MENRDFPALSGKEFLIMELLDENGEMFGLEMVESSQGELKKGTIYVTLGRMVEKDLLTSWEEGAGETVSASPRRLYAATDFGTRVFKAQEIALKYLNMGGW